MIKIAFKDLPYGARFKYPGGDGVWVALNSHGNGLIAQWTGVKMNKRLQSLCRFVDDEWSLESEVEIVNGPDSLQKQALILSIQAEMFAFNIEAEGMKAANQSRKNYDGHVDYSQDHFDGIASHMRDLANKILELAE